MSPSMRQRWTPILRDAMTVVVIGVLGALGLNALAPWGMPLRARTRRSDRPPSNPSQRDERWLTLDDVRTAVDLQLGVLIDIREPEQYRAGHIPGAINLPFERFGRGRPPALDALATCDTTVIVYCDQPHCGSAHIVAEQLRLRGFADERVRVFTDGYQAWRQAALEIDRER